MSNKMRKKSIDFIFLTLRSVIIMMVVNLKKKNIQKYKQLLFIKIILLFLTIISITICIINYINIYFIIYLPYLLYLSI